MFFSFKGGTRPSHPCSYASKTPHRIPRQTRARCWPGTQSGNRQRVSFLSKRRHYHQQQQQQHHQAAAAATLTHIPSFSPFTKDSVL